jgi:hypothetical protein
VDIHDLILSAPLLEINSVIAGTMTKDPQLTSGLVKFEV